MVRVRELTKRNFTKWKILVGADWWNFEDRIGYRWGCRCSQSGRNGYVMRGVLKLSKGYFGERYLIVEYIILENSTTYLEKSKYFVVCKVVILEKLNLFSGICRCLSSV